MSESPYLDNCNRCITETSEPVAPASVVPSGPGGVLASYRCPECGDTWVCGWADQGDEAA
jgi:hypothetical protein